MADRLPNGRFLLCPNGSHMSMYDDQKTYFTGLIGFLKDVDAGKSVRLASPAARIVLRVRLRPTPSRPTASNWGDCLHR